MSHSRFWFVAMVLMALTSCSNHPATGEVQFADGKPLEAGQVVFESRALKSGGACDIRSDGRFNITQPLPAGEYVVYITDARKPINPGAGVFGPLLVHEKFTDPSTSPLRVQVSGKPILLVVEPPNPPRTK